jgi:hypothetical protein
MKKNKTNKKLRGAENVILKLWLGLRDFVQGQEHTVG